MLGSAYVLLFGTEFRDDCTHKAIQCEHTRCTTKPQMAARELQRFECHLGALVFLKSFLLVFGFVLSYVFACVFRSLTFYNYCTVSEVSNFFNAGVSVDMAKTLAAPVASR